MKTFVTFGVLLFCVAASLAQEETTDECNNYQELSDAWRSVLNHKPEAGWDDVICDGNDTAVGVDEGWYRFTGEAGDRMPVQAPTMYRCGAHAGVFLNGQHPFIEEGIVTRQACAHFSDNHCYWSWDIKVRACPDGYYVYKLPKPVTCKLAYCGTTVDIEIPEEPQQKHVPDL
ncbi:oncoprotein-induced transcript 3 protein-like [Branchiostoma floridae]|nr:oncoprotein-induced transcript 3 protein-like [Branchiostoma floridae]